MVPTSLHMVIFGLGYSAGRLASRLTAQGWRVTGVRRQARGGDVLCFDDDAGISTALSTATHILSSVPPDRAGVDPVLTRYGDALSASRAQWCGYISSSGVYGDTGGAWVDESAPIGTGRRSARSAADGCWQKLRPDMRIFRLPGIYGPGRSMIERLREGRAHRIDMPGQIFSRVHVDDIVGAIMSSFAAPAGIYNIADDYPCGQNAVVEYAASLLGLPCPPLFPPDQARLSDAALGFYAENRRVANGKAKRLMNWVPVYPDYRAGLRAIIERP